MCGRPYDEILDAMNETPKTPGSIDETRKDWWHTRPRRPRSGRVFAGVAAGIARRYGIDPVLVRVVLVVSAIYGGSGLVFYLLGWLLLAADEDEVAPLEALLHRGRSSMSPTMTVLLCLALIPTIGFVRWGHLSTVFGFALLLAALWWLHRTRGGPPTEPVTPAGTPSATSADTPAATTSAQAGPLGTAPFASGLADPQPTPAPGPAWGPRWRASRVSLVTAGTALIVGGLLGLAAPLSGGWLNAPHILGVVLAVLGTGMIVGSFLRGGGGGGLIIPALLVAIIGFATTAIPAHPWRGSGAITYHPDTASQVLPAYQRSVGDVTLDLTALPNLGDVHTAINVDAGDLVVLVPRDATVEASCHAAVGHVNCLGRDASGMHVNQHANQAGAPGPTALKITLDASAGAGNVEVSRG